MLSTFQAPVTIALDQENLIYKLNHKGQPPIIQAINANQKDPNIFATLLTTIPDINQLLVKPSDNAPIGLAPLMDH